MASVALFEATTDLPTGLYTTNVSAPLGDDAGLRQLYAWGFYDFCAYTDPIHGICSNNSVGHTFRPFDTLLADVPPKFKVQTQFVIPSTSFNNSVLLASLSRSAYFLCLIATILAALAMFVGLKRGNFSFFLSSFSSILATLMMLTSSAMWTSAVVKAQAVNSAVITNNNATIVAPATLGIVVSFGPGMWLMWASCATLLLSTIPYGVSCLTYRG